MIKPLITSIMLMILLGACASKQNIDSARKTQESIDTALQEAGEVVVPDAEVPADDILDELLPGSGVSVPGLAEEIAPEARFDISVSNAPARLFFMSLVKDTDINMVVHPSVQGEISLDLKNVTVSEVMSLSREVYGYEFKRSSNGYIVLPARIQSKIFAVNYLNIARTGESTMTVSSGQLADSENEGDSDDDNSSSSNSTALQSSSINTTIQADFWSDLHRTITSIVGSGEGRSVVVDRHAGLIIVRAMPGELRDVGNYLDNAQNSLQRQVILETKIIEVKLSDSFQAGIDWTALSDSQRNFVGNASVVDNLVGSTTINTAGNATVTSALSLDDTEFANLFTVGGGSSSFGALINLLNTQGEVQVLSSPRISTVNNQKAVIKVGSDEFFVTEVSSNTSSNSVSTTTSPDITLTPFFSGIALDVTPQISVDGEVILHIHPSVSEITDQVKNITVGGQTQQLPLAFSTVRESDSVVRAKNGQVVVIGGLMQNTTADADGGVPGISDVPVVGNLFKQQRKVNSRSELVILLRPIVVDSNRTWSNYIKDSAERIENLRYDTPEGE